MSPDEIDKKYAAGLKKNICSNCHVGYLRDHHQWPKEFKKCGVCAWIISYADFDKLGVDLDSPESSAVSPFRSIVRVPSSED